MNEKKMNKFYDKETYLKTKFQLEECKYSEDKSHFCRICFWNHIVIKPLDKIPECRNCIFDTDTFKKNYKMKPTCSKYCIWFEWFEHKRKMLNTSF
jgi:hypothetical protein